MGSNTAQQDGQGGGKGQQVQLKPFRQGTQPTTRSTGGVFSITPGASAVPIQTFQVPPSNLLRQIVIEVTGTTSGNSADVAFNADMPLGALSVVNFALANGTSIVGGSNFSSYSLGMALKYFGFTGYGDPRNSAVYSVTTGTGATGGSFNLVYRIPVEVVARTALGCLPNTSTQTPFTLDLSVAPLASIYSTQPTTAPTVSITISVNGYWNGGNGAYSPTPQQFGTTNYINAATIPGLSGTTQIALPNVGLAYPIRNILFINRLVSSGARNGSDWPAPFQLTYRGQNWKQYDSVNLWQDEMSSQYGLNNASLDTATGLDTGVFNVTTVQDFDNKPGNELGAYLNTQVGDELELLGSFGAACNVTEIVNFLAVPGSPMAIQTS
jgi:hypothetical protein